MSTVLRRLALVASASFCLACADGAGKSVVEAGVDAKDENGAAPFLTELRFTSSLDASSPIVLVPAFASDTYDYYVPCAAGTNALTVSMIASPDALSVVLQPNKSPSNQKQSFSLSVAENQAVVAAATRGTATQEYWVRCLPHDFPSLRMLPHPDAGRATPGYYLVGNASVPTREAGYAMVLDGNGVPVWYYRERDGLGVFNVDSMIRGEISFVSSPSRFPYEIHQLSPLTITEVSVSGKPPDEHEMRILANGNYLVLGSPLQKGVDLTGLAIPLPDGGVESFGPNSSILGCNVQEVNSTGKVVWEWIATDHFDPVRDTTFLYPALGPSDALVVEPFHCNSIDVDANGNLLISARHMDSVFYVERSTGKVLWKMGGATYSKDNATYVGVADPFYRQHDARLLPGWNSTCSGGSGQISLFDDETEKPGPARAMVYDVNVGEREGGAAGCDGGVLGATVAWEYKGKVSIPAAGSFRLSEDGSRIVGWGTTGGFVFSEVNETGKDLVDLYFTDGSWSYRSIKIPLAALDLDVLRSTAGIQVDAGSSGQDGGRGRDATLDDAGSPDAISGGDAGSSDAGEGCHNVTGTGAARQCSFSSSTAEGFACASLAGSTSGSCPSPGLYGCCVEVQTADGGAEATTATCYYSSTEGADASAGCAFDAYQGMPVVWQTSAP
jgi:hypothetical protein